MLDMHISHRYLPLMTRSETTIIRLRCWLREHRVRANMSQLDLADRLGVVQGTLSRIESGHVPLTVDAFLRIAEAIEVDPVDALAAATRSEMAAASCDIAV